MLIRRLVLLLSLSSLSVALMAPGMPPSGTLLRVTSNPRAAEEPRALSDRFVLYQRGSLPSLNVYDRDTGTARQIAQDFQLEVAASDEHAAWLTPFETVTFLK